MAQSAELQALIAQLRADPYTDAKSVAQLRAETERAAAAPLPPAVQVRAVEAGGRPSEWLIDAQAQDSPGVFIYFYGGGYYRGSVASSRSVAAWISQESKARVLSVSYRLSPEHTFPAPVEDALAAWRWLLEQGEDPARMAVGGISAGGGLCLALMLAAREAGLPLPAAAVPMSPWTDLTQSGQSYHTKAAEDPVISKPYLERFAASYLGGQDAQHPHASPLFSDLAGLPPLLLQVGSAETMLDDTRRLAEKAQAAGVEATLRIWEGLIHNWQASPHLLPEARAALQELGTFVRSKLSLR